MKQKVEAYMSEALVARLDSLANHMGWSRSEALGEITKGYLDTIEQWGDDDQRLFSLAMENYKQTTIKQLEEKLQTP